MPKNNQVSYDNAAYKESAKRRLEWIKTLVDISKYPEMKIVTTARGKDGMWHPTHRIPLEEYEKNRIPRFIPDYYTVRAWEVPFEQDAPWDHPKYGVKILAEKTVEALISLDIPHKIYDSGGKGIHTHLFFKPPDNKKLLQIAEKKGIVPKDMRFLVFKIVNDAAGIPEEYRGIQEHKGILEYKIGKQQDAACINFDDNSGMGRLIRCAGGRKIDKEGHLIGYKTLIDTVPEHKTPVKKFIDVAYPDKNEIKVWIIPEIIFKNYVEDFKPQRKPKIGVSLKNYKGELLKTPCALSLRLNGAPSGQRSFSAKALAVFCVGDSLSYYDALDVLTDYYNRCDTTNFDIGEVKQWCIWAYDKVVKKPGEYVHCGHMRTLGICDREHCEYYKKTRKHKTATDTDKIRNPTWLAPWQQSPKARWVKQKGKRRMKKVIRW